MRGNLVFAASTLAALIASPAFAGEPSHGPSKGQPAVAVSLDTLSKTNHGGSLANLDANVKGLANVDANVLSTMRGKTDGLDLNATLGGGKGSGILNLGAEVGGKTGGRSSSRNTYDFGGGVGY